MYVHIFTRGSMKREAYTHLAYRDRLRCPADRSCVRRCDLYMCLLPVAMALEGRSHVRNVGWMVALSLIACRPATGFVPLPPSPVGALRQGLGFRLDERPSPRHEPQQVRRFFGRGTAGVVPARFVRTKAMHRVGQLTPCGVLTCVFVSRWALIVPLLVYIRTAVWGLGRGCSVHCCLVRWGRVDVRETAGVGLHGLVETWRDIMHVCTPSL